ncbi:MAG: histidine kinase, partial [Chitinophagaceae bacterium]
TFRDKENNFWFCTLGHGVFKLKSKEIKLYSFDVNSNNSEVFAVNYSNKKILAGVSFGKLYSVDIEKKIGNKISFSNKTDESLNAMTVNRLTSILPLNKDLLIYGFDSYLLKLEKNNQKFAFLKPIKSLSKINDKTILVGTSNYAVTMNVDDLKIIDTIYNQRCTAVEFFNKDYYIGTQNGLYVNKKRLDFLNERVTAITYSKDSIVWIATNSSGVFGLKNKKVLYHLTENNGLTSNNVKSLFADSTSIWVGTFSGLNKVNRKTFSITKFTMDDGLPSNIINSVYVDKNSIWLGTNLGLVNFDENKIDKTSFCNIDLVKIKNSDSSLNTQKIELAYNQNNISFEHTGISFKSEKAVVFFYKMEGIDSNWIETSSRIVSYPSMPSGNYTFKIYAINKLGVKSPILSYPILVKKPFWEETYFIIVTSILFLILVAITVQYFLSRIKKRNAEKTRYLNELHFAKQMALQTQMNPHFIFNCLNNIQRFIFKNDIENTNKYLTEFATLIRTTLENADKLLINLSDEISYLKMYLEMENLRFDNKLHFECIVHENVDIQNLEIPTMLLQPFIENSIKHGILNLKDREGLIKLEFFIENNFLNCKISDNGIGRKEAAILKLNEKLLFESKGIEITTRRIQMFNFNKKQEIKLEIKDLYDAYENAIGTEVHLQIPTDLNDND